MNNKIEDFYNVNFEEYDAHMTVTGHYSAQYRMVNLLESRIHEPILDLACGTGRLVEKLFKKHIQIYANDFSELITQNIKNIPLTHDDAETLQSYNKKFGTMISCNLFYYIQNKDSAIKRWKDLLKETGTIILIEEHPFMFPENLDLKGIVNPISPDEITYIMNEHSLKLVEKQVTKIDNKHNLYGLVFQSFK